MHIDQPNPARVPGQRPYGLVPTAPSPLLARRPQDGCTPLHFAAKDNQTEALQALLTAGANTEAVTTVGARAGWRPLGLQRGGTVSPR